MISNFMNILGVRVDNLNKKEILEKVDYFLSEPKFHQIATVNPEFILEAQKNEEFRNILNNCDLNIADGIGIKFAFWRFGKHLKCRMAGIDLVQKILKMAIDRGLSIFLAVNKDGLSTWEETRDAILKIYPNITISGANLNKSGIATGSFANAQDDKKNVIDILFVNFGAPYQELFIKRAKYDNIRLAIGVGGSFDFLTGKTKRAPVLVCQLGLEWLFRFFWQPHRWKRIWNAVVVFPMKVIFRASEMQNDK